MPQHTYQDILTRLQPNGDTVRVRWKIPNRYFAPSYADYLRAMEARTWKDQTDREKRILNARERLRKYSSAGPKDYFPVTMGASDTPFKLDPRDIPVAECWQEVYSGAWCLTMDYDVETERKIAARCAGMWDPPADRTRRTT